MFSGVAFALPPPLFFLSREIHKRFRGGERSAVVHAVDGGRRRRRRRRRRKEVFRHFSREGKKNIFSSCLVNTLSQRTQVERGQKKLQ